MAARLPPGTVYATGAGSVCAKCGWPATNCRCSERFDQAVPARIVAKLRIEKAGRGGKTVTVVDGLPGNRAFLQELGRELERACGTGHFKGRGRPGEGERPGESGGGTGARMLASRS